MSFQDICMGKKFDLAKADQIKLEKWDEDLVLSIRREREKKLKEEFTRLQGKVENQSRDCNRIIEKTEKELDIKFNVYYLQKRKRVEPSGCGGRARSFSIARSIEKVGRKAFNALKIGFRKLRGLL